MIAHAAALLALVFFTGAMIFAAARDVATMTISNRLVLSLAAAYLLLAPAAGIGVHDIASSIGAALAVLAGAFVMFARGWIGGGDAKLSAVVVLWLGHGSAVDFLFYTAVFGALAALTLLQFRRLPLPAFIRGNAWAKRLHLSEAGIPYGLAIAPAALLLLPGTNWAAALL